MIEILLDKLGHLTCTQLYYQDLVNKVDAIEIFLILMHNPYSLAIHLIKIITQDYQH